MARKGKAVKTAKATKKVDVVEIDDVKPDVADVKPSTLGEHEVVMAGDVVADVPQTLLSIKEQATKAIQALKDYKEQGKKKKKSLFPELDLGVFLLVVYKKPAMYNAAHNVRKLISLPQPDKSFENSSICLILPDLDKSDEAKKDSDVDAQARQWTVKLREEHNINKEISKVMTLRQVMRENSTPESKRKLADTYDIFLCDKRIHKSVCTFLGKSFNKARKVPIPVNLDKTLIPQIQDSYGKISMPVGACRTRVSLRFGNLKQPLDDLTTNIDEVVKKVVEYCPGGINNVRSMYVELPTGKPTLPIYVHMGSANEVKLQKAPKLRPSEVASETIECSTLPEGLGVQVRPNGKIRVVEEKTGKGVIYPTTRDEYQKRDDLKPKVNLKWMEKRRVEKQKKRQNRVKVMKSRKRTASAAGGQPSGKKAKKEEVKAEA
uniref:Ribosomal l1 domain-containing protein n=1 Tax=Steinernema glaseri TaxID=37863 RepID=A0A1I8A4X5_9BILA